MLEEVEEVAVKGRGLKKKLGLGNRVMEHLGLM